MSVLYPSITTRLRLAPRKLLFAKLWTDARRSKRDVRCSKRDVQRSKRENFERPSTPWGWLRSVQNFTKTRFRRFPTFDFSTPKNLFRWNFRTKNEASNQKSLVLEELRFFEPYQPIVHEKWPHFPRRSSLSVPWRRGSKTIFDFFVDFWTKTDLHFFFEDDDMRLWKRIPLRNGRP